MGVRSLLIEIVGDGDGAQKMFKDVDAAQETFGSKFTARAKDIMGKAGLAAGGALTAGLVANLGIEAGNDKLAAQLGLTTAESGRAGKLAGDLYKGNYGDSLSQVNDAIAGVSKNITSLASTSSADMERITAKTLNVAHAFDQDLGATTAAVGQMIKTGLAANADEAFDIITRGMQTGADKAGDLLEVYGEYGTQFRKLGLDGATATGLLTQGLQAGARDADVVADAFKEFSIRAIDGSKLTGEGFNALGLDASKMAGEIAKGGPAAAGALDQTLDRLRGMKDPVAQAAAATALFGTQAEDLGAALFALDPSEAVAGLGEVAGAADKVDKVLGDNDLAGLEKLKRWFETTGASFGNFVGPVGAAAPALGGLVTTFDGLGGAAGKVKDGLGSALGKVVDLGKGLGHAAVAGADFARTQALAAANVAKTTGALVAQKVAAVAQAVATKAAAVAQGVFNAVMALNPIFLIVLAIVAFVAVLVLAYQKVGWFRDFVDAAFRLIGSVISGVIDWVKGNWPLLLAILTGPIGLAVLFITRNWDTIKAGFSAVVGWIGDGIGAVVGFFVGWHRRAVEIVGAVWGFLRDGASSAVGWVSDRVNDIVGFITGIKDRIGRVAGGMFDAVRDAFRSVVNGVIGMWNRLDFGISISIPDWVPGIGGRGFRVDDIFPDIPFLAKGGNITGGGLALVGDDGPEILDLPRGARVSPLGSAGGGDLAVTVPVTIDGREVARATVRFTREELLRMQTGRRLGFS